MYKRVIVGIDGSPSSLTASMYAFQIGGYYQIPVVGVYVVDQRLIEESFLTDLAGLLGFTVYEGFSSKVKEFFEKQADVILDEFSLIGRKERVRVSVFQTTGVPYEEILNQADKEDLIVLGKKSRKPIKGFLLGSTADIVSRRSPAPVMLIPERYIELKRAVVAYDGSDNSESALKTALEFSNIYGSRVEVIHVGESDEKIKSRIESLSEHGNLSFHNLQGIPEEVIVSYCRENADILFMGAYSKGYLKELILGSVTSFVVHNLEIPIYLAKGYTAK